MLPRTLRDLLPIVGLVGIYYLAGRLGLSLAFVHEQASAVWPPTAIALSALILLGYRVWPAIWIGAFLVNFTTTSHAPGAITASFLIATGNTLEALVGAFLVNRFASGADAFERAGDILRFVVLAAILSTVISASLGVGALLITGRAAWDDYPMVGLTWWLGDMVSNLVLAPLLLIWIRRLPPLPSPITLLEIAAVFVLTLLTSQMVFGPWSGTNAYPLEYLVVPLVVWAAYRFRQRGASAITILVSIIAIYGTLNQFGPFAMDSPNVSLLMLQAFLGTVSLTGLVLAALLAERARAQSLLADSEQRYRHIAEDLKIAEQQRNQLLLREQFARRDAEEASRAKDRFLAVLSHELRTPLTPVMLTISDLEHREDIPDDVREDLHTIRTNIQLEARLIDDLLDLTRINRGKLQLEMQPVDLHLLLRRAIRAFRELGPIIEFHPHASSSVVNGDPARLQQIFSNLLSNACKFTPADGTVTVETVNPAPDHIAISVVDTGAGIAPELLPRLFKPFEQGAVRPGAGLGLGLAISRSLALAHDGSLTAHSEGVGHGSTFTLELPVLARVTAAEPRIITPEGAKPVERPLSILLVEDHEPTRRLLARVLEHDGHRVHAAPDVRSANDILRSRALDLLISDLGLPDGSGLDLMRSASEYGIPGIALSGYGMDHDLEQSRTAGFAKHLVKPVDAATLRAAIGRASASIATKVRP